MNFEFSPEQQQLREEAQRYLAAHCPSSTARTLLEGMAPYDAALWAGYAQMGFLGVTIAEEFGGSGLSFLELCVLAEETGRVLAPVPFSSSIYLATSLLSAAGSAGQKHHWLPKLAAGEVIGTLAPENPALRLENNRVHGSVWPVPDGVAADFAILPARGPAGLTLVLLPLAQPGVTRTCLAVLDPSRPHARLDFSNVEAEILGPPGKADALLTQVRDEAAILFAFEQLGGADRALAMARDFALERMAFGRPIGSFQAIKHKMADMYVSTVLARSNAYYGAWALASGAPELPVAAAAARISATQAFQHCARENIHIHGGMGFTWEADCHLFYRRANQLALALGPLTVWEDRLIKGLQHRNAMTGDAP